MENQNTPQVEKDIRKEESKKYKVFTLVVLIVDCISLGILLFSALFASNLGRSIYSEVIDYLIVLPALIACIVLGFLKNKKFKKLYAKISFIVSIIYTYSALIYRSRTIMILDTDIALYYIWAFIVLGLHITHFILFKKQEKKAEKERIIEGIEQELIAEGNVSVTEADINNRLKELNKQNKVKNPTYNDKEKKMIYASKVLSLTMVVFTISLFVISIYVIKTLLGIDVSKDYQYDYLSKIGFDGYFGRTILWWFITICGSFILVPTIILAIKTFINKGVRSYSIFALVYSYISIATLLFVLIAFANDVTNVFIIELLVSTELLVACNIVIQILTRKSINKAYGRLRNE